MNDKNKYNSTFIKNNSKQRLDKSACYFNLSEEELSMIEKIRNNPFEMMKNKSVLEIMSKIEDKVFKVMPKEEKFDFEKFKKSNDENIEENSSKKENSKS